MKLVFLERPEDFDPKFEVVSCFVRHNNEFLFLHRQDHKPEGNTWGRPAGKIDHGEDIQKAMIRELFEETKIGANHTDLSEPFTTYVRYENKDFIYYIIELNLAEKREITISNKEHKDYAWLTLQEALEKDLIPGEDECIEYYYKVSK